MYSAELWVAVPRVAAISLVWYESGRFSQLSRAFLFSSGIVADNILVTLW